MIIYKRNIRGKLFLLRTFFMVALCTCIISYAQGWKGIGCIALVTLLITSFISITGLTVYNDSIKIIPGLFIHNDLLEVKRYFFFGFIPVKWSINKDQTDSNLMVARKYELNEIIYTDEPFLDLVFSWFPYSSKFQGIIIVYKIANGDIRQIKAKLKDRELNVVSKIFKSDLALPVI